MSERKYTDEEVVKAIECCINADCLNCPQWSEDWYSGMCSDFLKSVLDLINRKNAEIAALTTAVDNSTKEFLKLHDEYQDQKAEIEDLREIVFTDRTEAIKNLKAEAIKEFAERLHKGIDDFRGKREMVMLPYTESALLIIERKIDNLVAEMTESDK